MRQALLFLCILFMPTCILADSETMEIHAIDGSQVIVQMDAISKIEFTKDRTAALCINQKDGAVIEQELYQLSKIKFTNPTNVEALSSSKVQMADQFFLMQNYPNPFNPSTTIGFQMTSPGYVKVQIFNVKGEKIRTLVSQQYQAGMHHVVWDGTNDAQQLVSNGIYFYRMKFNNTSQTKKLLFVK